MSCSNSAFKKIVQHQVYKFFSKISTYLSQYDKNTFLFLPLNKEIVDVWPAVKFL